ncbi:MAG: Npun_F0813 family protein [Phormidesmis sp.]
MFLLTPEDVEINSVQHPKQAKKVPILSYQDKTFRLLKVFSAYQYAEAHASWRDLTDGKGQACVLLEELHRYSIWRQVQVDAGLLRSAAPAAYIKACILLIQSLYSDVEQLLGSHQAKNFGTSLERSTTRQIGAAGGLGVILRIDPLSELLPQWKEDDISALLIELHRYGVNFFGRAKFTDRTLLALDDLPGNDKAIFLNWLKLSLLCNLWLG